MPQSGHIKEIFTMTFTFVSKFDATSLSPWDQQTQVLWNKDHVLTAPNVNLKVQSSNPLYTDSMVLENGYDYDFIIVGPSFYASVFSDDYNGSRDVVKWYNGGVLKIKGMNLDYFSSLSQDNGIAFFGGNVHSILSNVPQYPNQRAFNMSGGIRAIFSKDSQHIAPYFEVSRTIGDSIVRQSISACSSTASTNGNGNTYDISQPNTILVGLSGNSSSNMLFEDIDINPYGSYAEPLEDYFPPSVTNDFGCVLTNSFASIQKASSDILMPTKSRSLLKVVKKYR